MTAKNDTENNQATNTEIIAPIEVESAKVEFNENGTPISDKFDDIYFSNQDGLEECFYVFVQQNQLDVRFEALLGSTSKAISIGETGFGTGLNLMAAWSKFNESNFNNAAKLKFYSFEKYPLTKSDLMEALKNWPQVKDISTQLIEAYPEQVTSDLHLTLQNGQVEVHIFVGDVNKRIGNLTESDLAVDAWFLDGFAPSKNPDMWTQNLFNNMARLSKPDATLATFTAAGFVRRGLIEAGFTMSKAKGFGTKREMLLGRMDTDNLEQ